MKMKRMSVKSTFALIGILFFIIGAVLFTAGCYWIASDMNFKSNAETTEAVITDIDVHRRTGGKIERRAIVEYTVDGTLYETMLSEYKSGMYVGQKITVYYDPEHPGNVKTGSLFIPIMVTSMAGVFIIVGGVFIMININSSRRRKNLMENGDVFTGIITDVKMNLSVRINNRHPYKAECEVTDPYTNERYLYSSENIMNDISGFVGSEVTVYVDKNNKGKYYVDINELISKYTPEDNIHDYR